MPLVIDAYPSAFASRACSVSSRKRAGMSSPAGNCARIIKPNCMPATVVSLVARAWVESARRRLQVRRAAAAEHVLAPRGGRQQWRFSERPARQLDAERQTRRGEAARNRDRREAAE